jgi:hypothetical protein
MIKKLLNVIDGQEMLPIHGNNNCVPDLRDEDLGLVFYFHIARCKDFRVDTFRESGKDVSPRCPNGDTEIKRTRNGEDRIPDNVP